VNEDVTTFLERVLPRMRSADTALHNGDPSERIAMWSHGQPVTLFGAAFTATGWDEVRSVFDALGEKFSDCGSFEIEVLAADVAGDLGYIVAIERTTAAVDGQEPTSYALRVSTIFRRESGEWNVVHRHGDPYDESAGAIAAQLRTGAIE
jgi:ketosteroid isomerase-like protein